MGKTFFDRVASPARVSICLSILSGYFVGTIYQPTHPIFYQSIGNSYIFRCIDGLLIDGCDTGLSRMMYR